MVALFLCLNLIVAILILRRVNQLVRKTSDLLEEYEGVEYESFSDATEISTQEDLMYEEFIADRNRRFDERISNMQKEVDAYQLASVAEILHPNIENLPHEDIPVEREPREEYTL